jgi:hypothetical protein
MSWSVITQANDAEEAAGKIESEFENRYPNKVKVDYGKDMTDFNQCQVISAALTGVLESGCFGEGPYTLCCGGDDRGMFMTVQPVREVKRVL